MARTTYILLFGRLTERWAVLLSVERKSKTCTIFIARLIELPLHTISCAEFPQMCWVVCWNLYISEIPRRLLLVCTARRRTSRMTSQNRELPNRSRFYYRHRRHRHRARGRRRGGDGGNWGKVLKWNTLSVAVVVARVVAERFSHRTRPASISIFFPRLPLRTLGNVIFGNETRISSDLLCCVYDVYETFGGSAGDANENVQALLLWRNVKFLRIALTFCVDSRIFRRHQIITASLITREEIFKTKTTPRCYRQTGAQ